MFSFRILIRFLPFPPSIVDEQGDEKNLYGQEGQVA